MKSKELEFRHYRVQSDENPMHWYWVMLIPRGMSYKLYCNCHRFRERKKRCAHVEKALADAQANA